MNRLLFLFSLLFQICTFSQNEIEIDHPIEYLNDNCYSYYINLGKDSINETITRAEIYTIDRKDNCVPVTYKVIMTQFCSARYHLLATWRCEASAYHSMSFLNPKHCTYWSKPDSNTMYYPSIVPKTSNDDKTELKEYRPDSILNTDMECIAEFYKNENDSIRADTLFEKEGTSFDLNSHNGIQYWECSYYLQKKHGIEIGYYHINEVSGLCMNGNTNLKKFEGKWKYGDRKGKWYFYNKYGDLERIEYYKKGVCKKIDYLNL